MVPSVNFTLRMIIRGSFVLPSAGACVFLSSDGAVGGVEPAMRFFFSSFRLVLLPSYASQLYCGQLNEESNRIMPEIIGFMAFDYNTMGI